MTDQVFLLYHIRDDGQLLLIGAYRSEEEAKAAIERLKDKPGFVEYPSGFQYHAYRLGVDIWGEGFTENDDETDEEDSSETQPKIKPN